MKNGNGFHNWIPLISKLVWPFFIVLILIIFNQQAAEGYKVILNSIKAGRSVELGFLKLGEAAKKTVISDLSQHDISIEGIGGLESGVRKGGRSQLSRLQRELQANPLKSINTLIVSDHTARFSVSLLKQYISTLGLRFVVFQKNSKFDGWTASSSFVAQLSGVGRNIGYDELRSRMIVNEQYVNPNDSAKAVLGKMQELHVDSLPVVGAQKDLLFFANRGEILARLMTTIILK